mgnify:CR=1 FL=1|jgi:hypothetical protein
MERYILYSHGTVACVDIDGKAREICLPVQNRCVLTPTDNILADCDNTYACSKQCVKYPYRVPFQIGDKIMFQLMFRDQYNADPKEPVAGWEDFVIATLRKIDGTEITDMAQFASRYFVCHNGDNSYQVIEIDTGIEGFPECFELDFVAKNDLNETTESVCTQQFYVPDECHDIIYFEGVYSKKDCVGNYYAKPTCVDGFKFINKLGIEAKIVEQFPEVERTSGRNGKLLSSTTRMNYKIIPTKLIPQFMVNYLSKIIFQGRQIKINNETVKISNFAMNPVSDYKGLYRLEITYSIECATEC